MPTKQQLNKKKNNQVTKPGTKNPNLAEVRRVARKVRSAEANKTKAIEVAKVESVEATKVASIEVSESTQTMDSGSFLDELRAMADEAARDDASELKIQVLTTEISGSYNEIHELDQVILQAQARISEIKDEINGKITAIDRLKSEQKKTNGEIRNAIGRIASRVKSDSKRVGKDCSDELAFYLAKKVYYFEIPTISEAVLHVPTKDKKDTKQKSGPMPMHWQTAKVIDGNWLVGCPSEESPFVG